MRRSIKQARSLQCDEFILRLIRIVNAWALAAALVAGTVARAAESLVGHPPKAFSEARETHSHIGSFDGNKTSTEADNDSNGFEVKELFSKGVRLLKTNRAFEARQFLERAVKLAPKSAAVHSNLGLAYQNSGNIARAISEFAIALSLEAQMKEATLNLAGCYQSLGANKEAIEWYTKYIEENPDAPENAQIKDIIQALIASSERAGFEAHGPDYYLSIVEKGEYRWPKEKMPIKVFIDPGVDGGNSPVALYRNSFRNTLIDAFAEWSWASDNRIAYQLVQAKDLCDIYCSWTGNPQDVTGNGTQSERGCAKIFTRGNDIVGATLKILTKSMIEDGILSDDEMKKACLHEVGHVLGLQGHSVNNHDVMFVTVDTSTVWPVLSKRDKATITRLYAMYPKLGQGY